MNTASSSPSVAQPLTDEFGLVYQAASGQNPFDISRDEIIEACKTSGAVYFQGFNFTMEQFETFTNQYCHDWQTYQGGAHERQVLNPGGDKSVYSVNFYLGQKQQLTFELPLHCDMSYIKISPPALYFYCVQPAESHGETMLCDGAAVYKQLSPAAREALQAKRIKYIRKYPHAEWQGRFGTTDLAEIRAFCAKNDLDLKHDEATNTLYTEFAVSAVPHARWLDQPVFRNSILPVVKQEETGRDASLVRFEDGSPLSPELIAEIREVTTRLTKLVPMAQGDFMFVDNTRVLHGRKQFSDPRREVAIRMARSLDW